MDLDDQTKEDLKPAGQPEQASLNQCQLIAQNWCSAHAQLMVEIRFFCNVLDMRALLGPCSLMLDKKTISTTGKLQKETELLQ